MSRNNRESAIFEIKIIERVFIQIRQETENRRHGFSTESGPAAATGFHTQSNGFTNIRLHTAHGAEIIKRERPADEGKKFVGMVL